MLTLPEHLSSPEVFSGVRVTRSLVLYVCFVDRCLSFCAFSFDHCVVCSSSIYGFWLPLWYLQTLQIIFNLFFCVCRWSPQNIFYSKTIEQIEKNIALVQRNLKIQREYLSFNIDLQFLPKNLHQVRDVFCGFFLDKNPPLDDTR